MKIFVLHVTFFLRDNSNRMSERQPIYNQDLEVLLQDIADCRLDETAPVEATTQSDNEVPDIQPTVEPCCDENAEEYEDDPDEGVLDIPDWDDAAADGEEPECEDHQ
jgi:hypothetical protein